jgi:hypothetical protein
VTYLHCSLRWGLERAELVGGGQWAEPRSFATSWRSGGRLHAALQVTGLADDCPAQARARVGGTSQPDWGETLASVSAASTVQKHEHKHQPIEEPQIPALFWIEVHSKQTTHGQCSNRYAISN